MSTVGWTRSKLGRADRILRPRYRCWTSQRHKLAYFEVKKVASRSLIAWMQSLDADVESVKHRPIRASELAGVTTFAFVRDPFDRLASCWINKVRDTDQYARISPGFEGVSFSTFVDLISRWDLRTCDGHVRLQSRMIPRWVDHVGRFENLQADLVRIASAAHVQPLRLDHRNPSVRDLRFDELYTDDLARRVADLYRPDLERFGYQPLR